MGLLINNDLIWISIPKCASIAIEDALLASSIPIKEHRQVERMPKEINHVHIKKSNLYREFGFRETVCINRDWLERWISALQFFFESAEMLHGNTPVISWSDVDNDFVYKTFTVDFVNTLYSEDESKIRELYKSLMKNTVQVLDGTMSVFYPANYWKDNEPCTYEFDIDEMDKFVDFIEGKYGEKLVLYHSNRNSFTKSKLVLDDKLKNFIWDRFEKPFYKPTNRLIL